MLALNFEAARLTHPHCRLVILTDNSTQFNLTRINPHVSG
jgi:hypothetical protein